MGVGDAVGEAVGGEVGEGVGGEVGDAVGEGVGDEVGEGVGEGVGEEVGEGVVKEIEGIDSELDAAEGDAFIADASVCGENKADTMLESLDAYPETGKVTNEDVLNSIKCVTFLCTVVTWAFGSLKCTIVTIRAIGMMNILLMTDN